MVTLTESYANHKRNTYHLTNDGRIHRVPSKSGSNLWSRFSLVEIFRQVFLPQGFPDSVTEDYVEYQLWDTLQAFCSSITGTLATEAILKGVGVGDQTATPLAATVTWLLKDGAGMVGRIMFAWLKGTELDCFSKKWRLVADILNDIAIFTDLLAPHFKPIFTLMVCFSSCCRSIVGVAGGATRAALTQHQARRNNLADVSAKDGSQETLVNLSALICSLILVPLVSGKQMLIWFMFIIFTSLHLFSNYRAVKALRMDSLNETRYRILVSHFMKTGKIRSIKETNSKEPLFPALWESRKCSLVFGCSLQNVLAHKELYNLLSPHIKYLVTVDQSVRPTVRIILNKMADIRDVLLATFEAEVLAYYFDEQRNGVADFDVEKVKLFARKQFDEFLTGLKDFGWDTSHCLLNFDEFRYTVDE